MPMGAYRDKAKAYPAKTSGAHRTGVVSEDGIHDIHFSKCVNCSSTAGRRGTCAGIASLVLVGEPSGINCRAERHSCKWLSDSNLEPETIGGLAFSFAIS